MSLPRLSDIKISLSQENEVTLGLALNHIVSLIDEKTAESNKDLVDTLINYRHDFLLRACQREPKVENFCRTNPLFIDALKKEIQASFDADKSVNHPYLEIRSMNGVLRYTVFDLYLATMFEQISSSRELATAFKIEMKKSLDYACQLGLYDAFLVRCESLFNTIKNNISTLDENNAKILVNIDMLTNLYWGIGYLQAGCRLYTLGEVLLQAEQEDCCRMFREQAVKNFLCAALLENDSYSNEIMNNITANKGVAQVFDPFLEENNFEGQFTNWSDAKKFFCERIGEESYALMEKEAKCELETRAKARRDNASLSQQAVSSSSSSSLFQRPASPLEEKRKPASQNKEAPKGNR